MADVSLSAEQLILLQTYDTADLPFDPDGVIDKDVKSCGDSLFAYMWFDLAEDGRTPRSEYVQRLKRAELQVREVREALEYQTARDYTASLPLRDAIWWFIENVPLDASWRSNLFFDLRARYRDKDFEGWVRVNMIGDREAQDEEHDRFVVVDLKQLVEAGYVVSNLGPQWVATLFGWTSNTTGSRWAAWALAQEHHDKTTT